MSLTAIERRLLHAGLDAWTQLPTGSHLSEHASLTRLENAGLVKVSRKTLDTPRIEERDVTPWTTTENGRSALAG